MSRQLVLVHGRSQEQKDSIALKAEWLDAWEEGLAKTGLTLPITEPQVRFPYYGDTLYDMARGLSAEEAAAIVVRGELADVEEKLFAMALVDRIRKHAGITDAQLAEIVSEDVVARGPANWEWVQGILRAIDRFVPFGSGAGIAMFTRDVYHYLRDETIRKHIENGVSKALDSGVESVVVAHSLGSVVAYNLLRHQGKARGWNVPLFVTLGAPLGIAEIRKSLRSAGPIRCPECVGEWFNAMDERDMVALYPLDAQHFPLAPDKPAIANKRDVRNRTRNRHGIAGYLDDAEVASRIHAALR